MSGHHNEGVNGQQYAFREVCPNCDSPLAHLVKIYNGDNLQKGRWCDTCKSEVIFDNVVVVDIPLDNEHTDRG